MAGSEAMNSWVRIREGANDVERLIGQKQYNLAMIKARQTLEFMVQCLTEKFGLGKSADLSDAIDRLYHNGAISAASADHYHRIRQIGNRAAHEGDDKPSSANEAYHLLSQELYSFANDFSSRRVRRHNNASGRSSRTASGGKKSGFPIELVFKIAIAVLIVLIIFALVRALAGKKPKEVEQETEMQITVAETAVTAAETMSSTEPETTRAAAENPRYMITGDGVRVRSTPSTEDNSNVIGSLARDTVVEYMGKSDDGSFTRILYNNSEAYVSSDFVTQITEENEGAQ